MYKNKKISKLSQTKDIVWALLSKVPFIKIKQQICGLSMCTDPFCQSLFFE